MNQEGIIETLKRALGFYAAENTYKPHKGIPPAIEHDCGEMAKITLEIVAKAEQSNNPPLSDDHFKELENLI